MYHNWRCTSIYLLLSYPFRSLHSTTKPFIFFFRQHRAVPREDYAAVELHRLHAQLHDCVPGAVRGVDRVHVGLHVGGQQSLCAFLPCHCRHWQPCRKLFFLLMIPVAVR